MSERRTDERPRSKDRRDIPRPALWLNLLLLCGGLAALAFARQQRRAIDADYTRIFDKAASGPSELNALKTELAEMFLSKESLDKELDSRLGYIESLKTLDFYLSIDTAGGKLSLNYGKDVIRDATVRIGPPAVVKGPGEKTWTFVPLKGAFTVAGKNMGQPWRAPLWAYAMSAQPAPRDRPFVPNGLGKYVILLPNDYVIHSPPAAASPLKGPKPGSFMAPEADLKAIWDRITPQTRVYIF